MAAGDRLLAVNGNRLLGTSSGNRKLSDGVECCCGSGAGYEVGEPCDSCTGDTPSQLTVTFADVTVCTCTRVSVFNNFTYGKKLELNGTYCLTQAGDNPCVWKVMVSSSILQWWNNSPPSCTGTPTDLGTTHIYVGISGSIRVMARHSTAVVKIFDGTLGSPNCTGTNEVSNGLGACGNTTAGTEGGSIPGEFDESGFTHTNSVVLGTGGTATVTAGC